MKKVLISLTTIFGIVALVIGVSGAFFNDTETSTGNILQAGAIDLLISNSSYVTDANGDLVASTNTSWGLSDLTNQLFFNFNDLKPGDIGEDTIGIQVQNNDAWVCAAARVTEDSDVSYTEPELDGDDTTVNLGNPLGTDGELAENLNFAFWADDGDNVLEVGEETSIFVQGPASNLGGPGAVVALADSTINRWTNLSNSPLVGASTVYIGKAWCFGDLTETPLPQLDAGGPDVRGTGFTCSGGDDANNAAQTDRVAGDFQFYAVQSRNNENFTCASGYDPDWPDAPAQTLVGAALGGYSVPSCTVTVTGAESIQTAVSGAAENSTVCVDGAYNGTGDNVAIRIETLGLTLAATTQGVDLDVPVVLSNSNVTVTGFDGTIGQAESPAEQAAFYLDNDADGFELSYNTVTGGVGAAILTETGAALAGGSIMHNVLGGATQGMYLNPHTGSITVEYNDIDNNAAGIAGLNGAVVRYNEFGHTTLASEAIGIDSTFDANTATVNFNNFLNDMEINVYGTVSTTINAENNFFSTSAAAQASDSPIDADPATLSQYTHN